MSHLDFGEHRGETIEGCPIAYIRWLANCGLNGNICINDLYAYTQGVASEKIWQQSREIRASCSCGKGVAIGSHAPNCLGSVLGSTLAETRLKLKSLTLGASELEKFPLLKKLQQLRWLTTQKKSTVKAARTYLKGRCWSCGGVLPAIGSARANGARHAEWHGRHLHKKCWKARLKKRVNF
jgi:hypothetical protein